MSEQYRGDEKKAVREDGGFRGGEAERSDLTLEINPAVYCGCYQVCVCQVCLSYTPYTNTHTVSGLCCPMAVSAAHGLVSIFKSQTV